MAHKRIILFISTVLTFLFVSFTHVVSAQAANACWYTATNGSGWSVEALGTSNRKMKRACRRAKRKCNRKLKRAQRRHEIPRGAVTPSCKKSGTKSGF